MRCRSLFRLSSFTCPLLLDLSVPEEHLPISIRKASNHETGDHPLSLFMLLRNCVSLAKYIYL